MRWFTLCLLLLSLGSKAQPRVLHFTRTSGYDHGTRAVSFAMFQGIASELGLEVDDDATGAPFSDPASLAEYSAIVFSNTSGNAILNAQQRSNFEAWVANGGHVLGIHAASDTYRHSSANGSNTGTWDFYAELIGASVQENPNHVAGTPPYALTHVVPHASTANLPDPWVKNEEYYYWEGGYYGPDNVEVLRVEETVGPNGLVNSYDTSRPMSWYRELPSGSRVFYTALGHAQSNYTSDAQFRTHIKDALGWLLEGTTGLPELGGGNVHVFPNPTSGTLTTTGIAVGSAIRFLDLLGREVARFTASGAIYRMEIGALHRGNYVLLTETGARLNLCVMD